jgi:uncharacterized delta-60 repeat protein
MKKLINRLNLFFILSILFGTIYAQVTQDWAARYNGTANSNDVALSIAVDGSGNVYVTGYSTGSGTDKDYVTIKYNSSGVQQWEQRYNGPGNGEDWAYSVAVDGTGNVYVTGYSVGSGTDKDYVTIKYNSSGVQQWEQRYNGPGNREDEAYSLAVDGSGNVYVTGNSFGSGTGYDYATIKYNTEGAQQWIARYNGPGNEKDKAASILVDDLGNVYITGISWGKGTDYDITTIKYNENGVQIWFQRYNGPGNSDDETDLLSFDIDGSGNIYVTGGSMGNGTGYDFVTIKYDTEGLQQWVQRYNGPGNGDDMASSIAVDKTGNVYVTGQSIGKGSIYDYCTIKYNTSGDSLWVRRYNGPGNSYDSPMSIAVDDLGNSYVTGLSFGSGTGYDFATIKYNSEGVQDWIHIYNCLEKGDDSAFFIVVDDSGNVYVTGKSYGNGTGADYATIKIKSR